MFKSKYAPSFDGHFLGNAALVYYDPATVGDVPRVVRDLMIEFGRYAREFPDADLEKVEVYQHSKTPEYLGGPSIGWRID